MASVNEQAGGRPRRFEPATEIQMITAAATKLLRQNDYEHVSVGAILTEAGLSTRSFYRHYSSKDELLITLYRQNAEQAARRLSIRVRAAARPIEALESWVDELLSFIFEPRKARRVAVYDAASARRAVGYAEANEEAIKLLVDPLREVLERGARDGSFPATVPERDARSINALVWDLLRWNPPLKDRSEALAHVMRFVAPGLSPAPAGRRAPGARSA